MCLVSQLPLVYLKPSVYCSLSGIVLCWMFLSEPLSLLMPLWDPNWTLVLYIDLALQLSCSAFTVGVMEEECGPPMISATSQSPPVMTSTPQSPADKAVTPKSQAVMFSIESVSLRSSLTIDCTPCYNDGHSMCLGCVCFFSFPQGSGT